MIHLWIVVNTSTIFTCMSTPHKYLYIYKEELKTVVCKLLVCTQPNRHETFTALWNPYRRVSSRGRRAQIHFSQGAYSKKQKMTVRHFGFTEKVYGLPCTVLTLLLWKRHHRNAIVRISFFFMGAIAVEARRRLPLLVILYFTRTSIILLEQVTFYMHA